MNNARPARRAARTYLARACNAEIDASVYNLFRVRCRRDETVTSRYPRSDVTFTEANDTLSKKDMFIKYTRNASTFRDDIARDNA